MLGLAKIGDPAQFIPSMPPVLYMARSGVKRVGFLWTLDAEGAIVIDCETGRFIPKRLDQVRFDLRWLRELNRVFKIQTKERGP